MPQAYKKDRKPQSVPKKDIKIIAKPIPWYRNEYIIGFILAAIAFILYANTFKNDYALDDYFAITTNKLVKEGFQGIPNLLRTDFWQSADKNLGYYRPLSLITFAIEFQFFGLSPHISHFINVLLYALTVFCLFKLLRKLFPDSNILFSTIITLLFAAHPLHTELVANIKGRDELLSFLAIILMLCFNLRFIDTGKIVWMAFSLISLYLGLLSKESAFVGIALLPLVAYYYKKTSIGALFKLCLPFVAVFALFFIQKTLLLGNSAASVPKDLIFYPYFQPEIRYASSFMLFLYYFRMLLFPHPLLYDYGFNQLPGVQWDNIQALAGLLLFLAIVTIGVYYAWKKKPMGFAILFFYITIAPAIGFVLLRGGIFAERLLYASSFGFCIAVMLLLDRVLQTRFISNAAPRIAKPGQLPLLIGVSAIAFIGFSYKTITRNHDWKDNFTLVSADQKAGSNSAQNHYQYGMLLIDKANTGPRLANRDSLLKAGIVPLKLAVKMVPNFADAYFRLGFAYELLMETNPSRTTVDTALLYFTRATETGPTMSSAFIHLGHINNWLRNYDKSLQYYSRALDLDPGNEAIKAKLNEIIEAQKQLGLK